MITSLSHLLAIDGLKDLGSWASAVSPALGGLGPLISIVVIFIPASDDMLIYLQHQFEVRQPY